MLDYYQNQKPNKSKGINTNVVLYIGELPPDIDQYELHQFITSFGKFNIESLLVKPTKENKAYAYVKFKSKLDGKAILNNLVEKARKAIHLKTLRNYVIRAEPFKQKESEEDKHEEANLFVKNLPSSTTPKEVYDLFSKYGTIISIKLKQNNSGECLGYGYVNYDNLESAQKALDGLNNTDFGGKTLMVSTFSNKSQRNEEDKFPLVMIKQVPPSVRT
jgi:polyadenylate-binding protein